MSYLRLSRLGTIASIQSRIAQRQMPLKRAKLIMPTGRGRVDDHVMAGQRYRPTSFATAVPEIIATPTAPQRNQ
jgi:hypothetical protein